MVGQKNPKVDDRPAAITLPLGRTRTSDRADWKAERDLTLCLCGPPEDVQAVLRAFRS